MSWGGEGVEAAKGVRGLHRWHLALDPRAKMSTEPDAGSTGSRADDFRRQGPCRRGLGTRFSLPHDQPGQSRADDAPGPDTEVLPTAQGRDPAPRARMPYRWKPDGTGVKT